jgi:hypothetical protein
MPAIDTLFSIMGTLEIILLYGWPFIIILFIIILKIKWKNWPVDAVIIEKRGNNLIKSNDRAGKYKDPYTSLVGYKLQKSKDTLPVVNYEWLLVNVVQFTTIFDRLVHLIRGSVGTLFLFKYGSKQYKPMIIKVNGQSKLVYKEIKDKNNNPIIIKIYEQFDPRKQLGNLEFEVVDWDNMNFMVQEQRASIERRKKKSEFLKSILIPLGMAIVVGLVCIIMIKFSYDYAVTMANMGKSAQAQASQPATKPNIPIISDIIPGG